MDIIVPADKNTTSPERATLELRDVVLLHSTGLTFEYYPKDLNEQLQRLRPTAYPGSQLVTGPVSPVCRKQSSLHKAYCWPANSTSVIHEIVMESYEKDSTGLYPAGYYMIIRNALQVRAV